MIISRPHSHFCNDVINYLNELTAKIDNRYAFYMYNYNINGENPGRYLCLSDSKADMVILDQFIDLDTENTMLTSIKRLIETHKLNDNLISTNIYLQSL